MTKRKYMTMIIPASFMLIGAIFIGMKLFLDKQTEDPLAGVKKNRVEPALQQTAAANTVLFKKFQVEQYNKAIKATLLNRSTLMIELKGRNDTISHEVAIRQKQKAIKYFTPLLCRIDSFKALAELVDVYKQSKTPLIIQAEIYEVSPQGKILWSTSIAPESCQ